MGENLLGAGHLTHGESGAVMSLMPGIYTPNFAPRIIFLG